MSSVLFLSSRFIRQNTVLIFSSTTYSTYYISSHLILLHHFPLLSSYQNICPSFEVTQVTFRDFMISSLRLCPTENYVLSFVSDCLLNVSADTTFWPICRNYDYDLQITQTSLEVYRSTADMLMLYKQGANVCGWFNWHKVSSTGGVLRKRQRNF